MKILNYFKKVANVTEHINTIIVQPPKIVCDICYGVGLVDHENAEFRTVKHWCQCKKPKEINESNRFWWNYNMLSKNGFTLMSKAIKDGCNKELPNIHDVFEPAVGIIYYNDNGFLGVGFYVKKKLFMSKEIYWCEHYFLNYKDIIDNKDLCHILLTKILESGIRIDPSNEG